MNCSDCRIQEQGDCATPGIPCGQFRPKRGKLRDWLCDTGLTEKQFLNSDTTVAPNALKGSRTSLPAPYNRSKPGEHERDLQRAAIDAMWLVCGWVQRIEGGGKVMHGQNGAVLAPSVMKGLPDILGCINGRLIAVEVKKRGGSISPEQVASLLGMERAGARVCICVDPSKLVAWLKGGASTATTKNGIPVV
jgi:hypothetical protein